MMMMMMMRVQIKAPVITEIERAADGKDCLSRLSDVGRWDDTTEAGKRGNMKTEKRKRVRGPIVA